MLREKGREITIKMSYIGRRRTYSQTGMTIEDMPSSQASQRSRYGLSQSESLALRKRRNLKRSQKAMVRRTIASITETKCLQTSGSLVVRSMQAGSTDAQVGAAVMCLTPQGSTIGGFNGGYAILGNGIGQDQRIGDRVQIKGYYMNYLIRPLPYDVTTNTVPAPCIVQVFVLRPRAGFVTGMFASPIVSGANAKLFENQANTDSGLTGSLVDLLRKVDKDNFEVLARREYKIGYQGNLNTSNQLNTLPNNDFNAYVKDRVKCKGESWRVNRLEGYEGRNIFFFVTALRADGTAIPTSQIPVALDFNLAVYYTDL